jgi:hypothetical protein
VFFSSRAERVNGMKSQKWGLCPRILLMKRFSQNEVFREMKGNVLEWVGNNNIKKPLIIKLIISGFDYDFTDFMSFKTPSFCRLILLLATVYFSFWKSL